MRIGSIIGDITEQIPLLSVAASRLRKRCQRKQDPYRKWVLRNDSATPAQLACLRQAAHQFSSKPVISVVMPVFNVAPQVLDETIASIRQQVYEHWELCIAVDASTPAGARAVLKRHTAAETRIRVHSSSNCGSISDAANTGLGMASGEYVARLDHNDLLPPHALYWVVETLQHHPDAVLLYSDEDVIDDTRRRFAPHLKSDFNQELLLARNIVSHLGVYRRQVVVRLGGFRSEYDGAHDHDLALRVAGQAKHSQIVHIPRVLCHRRVAGSAHATSSPGYTDDPVQSRRAVADHLRQIGHPAEVVPAPEATQYHRIKHPLPDRQPLVSIVMCTRDHADLLQCAIDSIIRKTTYKNYRITIVDNGSQDPAAVDVLASLVSHRRITVIRDDSQFNYSRLNNRAVASTQGQLVCLLNDDVEVITDDWLEELVSHAIRPDVGAVGARLWYPDGTLQHGGVILGIGGVAAHAHSRLKRGSTGYQCRAVLAQEFSAVTGACLMVRREVFDEIGGLDERLRVAFNDIDLCLRLRKAGYRHIWTPYAELVHHESASRGQDDTPEKRARFRQEVSFMRARWGTTLSRDPYYSPLFSMRAANFTVSPTLAPPGSLHAA